MNPHTVRIVPADSPSSRKQGFALSITLNCWIVLILDAGLPPMIEEFLEQAEGRACYAVFSIFMGFDNQTLHPDSCDYTTFQTLLGLYQLTRIHHQSSSMHAVHPEIPTKAMVFFDNIHLISPRMCYELPGGGYEVMEEKPRVHRFVWEHVVNQNQILQACWSDSLCSQNGHQSTTNQAL